MEITYEIRKEEISSPRLTVTPTRTTIKLPLCISPEKEKYTVDFFTKVAEKIRNNSNTRSHG